MFLAITMVESKKLRIEDLIGEDRSSWFISSACTRKRSKRR
jgi:hypothetical protein